MLNVEINIDLQLYICVFFHLSRKLARGYKSKKIKNLTKTKKNRGDIKISAIKKFDLDLLFVKQQ